MAHLDITMTREFEPNCVRRIEWDKEIVKTDGGREVRNSRWSQPLRSFDISLPPCERTEPRYLDLQTLWSLSEGGTHSFWFYDWTNDDLIAVRFDTPLQITALTPQLDHIDTFTLQEVRG